LPEEDLVQFEKVVSGSMNNLLDLAYKSKIRSGSSAEARQTPGRILQGQCGKAQQRRMPPRKAERPHPPEVIDLAIMS